MYFGVIRQRRRIIWKTNEVSTVIIEKEGNGYCVLCPELDIASQGDSIEEARNNLVEAGRAFP